MRVQHDDPTAYADWLAATTPIVHALLKNREEVHELAAYEPGS